MFLKQAQRIHNNAGEFDDAEVLEEAARMREHVLSESDQDKVSGRIHSPHNASYDGLGWPFVAVGV